MGIIKSGVCLHLKSDDQTTHLHVVLSDPHGDPPTVAVVSWSTNQKADKTVVLNVGDHPFIKRETFVVYAWAKVISAKKLEAATAADLTMKHRQDCSPELLQRIREGIFKSPFIKPKIKEYCKDKF